MRGGRRWRESMDARGFKIETPAESEPWRKVLMDAADYIQAHGWWNNGAVSLWRDLLCLSRAGTKRGGVCAIIALGRVDTGGAKDWVVAYDKLRAFLGMHIDKWNDAPGRTAAKVCA